MRHNASLRGRPALLVLSRLPTEPVSGAGHAGGVGRPRSSFPLRLAATVTGKDGLMRLPTGVGDLEGVHFPEFRDRPGGGTR